MPGNTVRFLTYRLRTTFGRRWGAYLSVVLLVGLIGGLAMASVAGGRRTGSSYATYLASTSPSDLKLFTDYDSPSIGSDNGYDPAVIRRIDHLPLVDGAATVVGFDGNLEQMTGVHLHQTAGESPPAVEGSPDGLYAREDRIQLLEGRLADPSTTDQAVVNEQAAHELGVHVGSVVHLGLATDAEENANGTPTRLRRVTITIVGIVQFNDQVIEDQVDTLGGGYVLLTPTLTRQLAPEYATYSGTALQLAGGAGDSAAVIAEASHLLPAGLAATASPTKNSLIVGKANRTLRPEAIAFEVFGLLAGLAALLIGAQALLRQLRLGAGDRSILRSLGAGPAMSLGDSLSGALLSVVGGAAVAVGVAVALSPLSPLGPVRPIYPDRGFNADWVVLGLGALALVVVLGTVAVVAAILEAPNRSAGRRRTAGARESTVVGAAANAGLSVPAVTGLRLALEPGSGSSAVPVRSAIVGTVVAGLILAATFTFGASLTTLVSHPALYGWNWNYVLLSAYAGAEDLPAHQTATFLARDPSVTAWTSINFVTTDIDGQSIPSMATAPNPRVAPPILTGHGLEAADQIVLGADTLAALHKRLGDSVVVRSRDGTRHTLVIVGTATMPAAGGNGSAHLEMGTGALLSSSLFSAATLNLQDDPIPGPDAVAIRVRGGTGSPAALRSLETVSAEINALPTDDSPSGGVISVLRPAEIVDDSTIETIPTILGMALAAGAVVALGLTLVASVRRRRRDLALLKALGLTGRQLAAAVSWQSTFAVAVGMLIGVPLGIVMGRVLWDLYAAQINAVSAPSVPLEVVALVAVGALVLANLVAAVPGRIAARTPTAVVLRSE